MEPTANVPYLTDGRRVREFRRYYQSKHTRYVQSFAGARHDVTDACPVPPPSEADYTLSAIAKCVVHSIDVDKVMISLLDDNMQYFLGGATKETSSVVLGDGDPSLWFGCHSIGIRGGICEVACSVTPEYKHYPFYVVPDIKDVPQWRDVVGDYRFYVGIPIKTRSGDNIGTLFGFSTRPRPDLSPEEKLVMERMASAVMNHLELELSVLERSRVLRMNRSLADFASNKSVTEPERAILMPHSSVYRRAAELLRFGLDCSGVIFVTMDAASVANPDRSHVSILGGAVSPNNRIPCDFKADALCDAIQYYPGGHLFHFDNSGRPWAIAEQEEPPSSFFTNPSPVALDRVLDNHEDEPYVQTVAGSLRNAIPSAQQMLIAPLRSVREGVVSAAIAWRDDWHSIFSSAVELPFMNCFCISVFATMLHEDALTANKHKADFLANDTRRSRTQQVLIEDIQNCGRVLLNTIDQLLDLSDLSQAERAGDFSGDPEAMEITAPSRTKSQRLVQPIHADLASLCEDAVHSVLLSQSFHGAVETMSKGARHDLTALSKASRKSPSYRSTSCAATGTL
ncbi:unnamed protein product [Parascedosporium putredinis]|uniref:GAF domain-containing protein n=1 Tax=Parascedosporium putredinis TaxID=1442378 RepID=A0A9P1HC55_9PEZI|nr:unnamed protein product [Parascedosporium putredinis]CAI8002767.1 unnamed protein product [Parascedosporium putredinis]